MTITLTGNRKIKATFIMVNTGYFTVYTEEHKEGFDINTSEIESIEPKGEN